MKKSENILILGLGGMGRYLAGRLSHEQHHVTVIEPNAEKILKAEGELDARLIRGDALDFACWEAADAKRMDYVIAVTDNDAANILSVLIAERLGIAQKIARVRSMKVWSPDALLSAEDLHIDLIIRPEELAAQEIVRLLKTQAGNVRLDLGDGELQVVATHVSRQSPLSKMLVRDLAEKHDEYPFQVVCVARDIETFVPDGDFKLLPDDHVYLLAATADIPRLMKLTEITQDRRHRVLVIGGGLIGARVAELLESSFPVKVLEKDEATAEALTHRLKHAECLHGDGTEAATLIQAGLLTTDTIITTTGENETNIMTSVLAKHLIKTRADEHHASIGKTIALVKKEDYLVLASAMGADLAVNRKILAANIILRYIRRGHVLSVAHLHGCDAEVVELLADPGAPITRSPLAALPRLRGRIMIGAVCRQGTWSIARGGTHIAAGDRAVCICRPDDLGDLQRLFLA